MICSNGRQHSVKLTQGNLSPLEFSPTQDPAGGWPIVFWSMDGQSLSSHITHSSLAHGNVYRLCENYKQKAYIYICDVKLGFCTQFLLLRQNIETDLIYFCNILRQRQNGRHFPDDIFKCIFLNENVSVAIKIILGFVTKGRINNIPALFQIMAWRRPSNKPSSETMMVRLPTNKFQWNHNRNSKHFHWRKDVLLVSSQSQCFKIIGWSEQNVSRGKFQKWGASLFSCTCSS